jgi:hypothetical protein
MMDDPVAKRLRDLLDITMKLRENIDELLGGLSKQLEALEKGMARSRSGNRRRQLEQAHTARSVRLKPDLQPLRRQF